MKGRQIAELLRGGCAIAWWPPRNDVGDVGRSAVEPDRRHHAVEQLARAAHKRQPRNILVASRRFAHEHHPGFGVPVGENEVGRSRAQGAALEPLQHCAQLFQACCGSGCIASGHDRGISRRRCSNRRLLKAALLRGLPKWLHDVWIALDGTRRLCTELTGLRRRELRQTIDGNSRP